MGRSDSKRSPKGNQVNFANSRSGEILSLEDSTIGEVHYNAQHPLIAINREGVVNVAEKTDPNLWHVRLGHMSQAGLDRLMGVGYISKRQAKTDFYEHC